MQWKIGILGSSRGAEHGLLVTALMVRDGVEPIPDALAAHAPPDVICGAFDGAQWRDQGDPGWRAWDPAERAWTWRGTSENLLPTTPIEIELYSGPLFLSYGTNDELWSPKMSERLVARLKSHHRTPEIHAYDETGHIPTGQTANRHNENLIGFFGRHLS